MNNPPYGIKPSAPQPKQRPRKVGKSAALGAAYDLSSGEMEVNATDAVAAFFKVGTRHTVSLARTNMNRTRCTLHGEDHHGTRSKHVFYAQGYPEAHKGRALFPSLRNVHIEVERRRPRKESVTPRHMLPPFVKFK